MQASFDFAADDLAFMRGALRRFDPLQPRPRRAPIWQLVRSLIGSRTYDTVSEPALRRLMARWPDPGGIAEAGVPAVLECIADVNYAEDKARNLVATMRQLGCETVACDLGFLRAWPVRAALAWLERLPGVGPKVSAATLNASTLAMPVFIVDSHVHRILLRFGFVGEHASAEHARDAVTATGLDAAALLDLFTRMKRLGQDVCHWADPCLLRLPARPALPAQDGARRT